MPRGLRGLVAEDFSITAARNALKYILSQSNWHDRENFLLASLASFPVLPLGLSKLSAFLFTDTPSARETARKITKILKSFSF